MRVTPQHHLGTAGGNSHVPVTQPATERRHRMASPHGVTAWIGPHTYRTHCSAASLGIAAGTRSPALTNYGGSSTGYR